MIGEIRQNFTEASASVGLLLATALRYLQSDVLTWYCTFLHNLVKISILDIWFLFY